MRISIGNPNSDLKLKIQIEIKKQKIEAYLGLKPYLSRSPLPLPHLRGPHALLRLNNAARASIS